MLYKIIVLPAKLVQKHISPAGTAPSTNIFHKSDYVYV